MSTARLTPRPSVPYRCPICRSQVYEILEGQRSPLAERLPVYRCAGCSVLFTDPERFTRFEPYSASVAQPASATTIRQTRQGLEFEPNPGKTR